MIEVNGEVELETLIRAENGAFVVDESFNRFEYFNKFYSYKWNRIFIKNQKTRWGSCSKRGNLNFNYRIALLPPEAADYIIVHELCHLKEFNHSRNFWKLVEQQIPNYKILHKALK